MSDWIVARLGGDAGALHERNALGDRQRMVSLLDVDGPAVVLGSTQREDIVDAREAEQRGVQLVRRQTGGGAVYLAPDEHVWIDVTIPTDDPLWADDVARAFGWLGAAWSSALADVGVPETVVNDAAVCHSVLGRLICFAGLGFGEVSTREGAKIVGIAQRRTRAGAWFQCTVPRVWETSPYALLLEPGLRRAAGDPAATLAEVLVRPVPASGDDLLEALLRHLP